MSRFPWFGWRGVLTAALFGCGLNLLVAQQDPQTPTLQNRADVTVIRTNVRRVVLDVVVTGKNGEPVRGLTKEDFAVTEDGKEQTIKSFDVHDFDATPEFVPPKVPPLGPNTYLNLPKGPEKGPLYVVLYDMWNMETADQPFARKQLMDFINNKPEGTRFAIIVLSDGMNLVQGFTSDKNTLLATLDPKSSKPHIPQIFLYQRNYGKGDGNMEISVFTELAHYLEGFSGRKNVIWLSGDFPLALFNNGDDNLVGDSDYIERVKVVVDTLARDQVSIYPVDVRGAIVTEEYAPAGASPQGSGASGGVQSDSNTSAGSAAGANASSGAAGAAAASSGSSGGSHAAGGPGYSLTSASYQAAEDVAKATGGHAYYGTNDLSKLLTRATVNGSNYYTLTYSPTNEEFNGKLRNIHVELAKKGYTLAYRRSYFGVNHSDRPRVDATPVVDLAGARGSIPQEDPLSMEMRHGAPMAHDLIFRAQFHAVGSPVMATPEQMSRLVEDAGALRRQKQNKPAKVVKPIPLQSYMVDYRVMDAQAKARASVAGGSAPMLEFVAAAFDADGNMLSGVLQNASRDASDSKAEAGQAKFFSVEQQIDVPLKAAWIRVAVRDLSTDRVGTLEVPLPLVKEPANDAAAAKVPEVGAPSAAKQ